MDDSVIISDELLPSDILLLKNLASDIHRQKACERGCAKTQGLEDNAEDQSGTCSHPKKADDGDNESFSDESVLAQLRSLNDPTHADFEPTVFSSWDLRTLASKLPAPVYRGLLLPYVNWARGVARHETDVVMVTHLILYFATSVPSAIWLYSDFSYLRGVLHFAMQFYYMGTYTLMMHQHIHAGGVLTKRRAWARAFDLLFPYVTDPLMGHTWNTYFYHHVKHHHVEGNGPDDLSSTVRYQRDNVWHFLHYLGRFFFLIWLDLPLYFLGKNRPKMALKAACWELGNYAALLTLFLLNSDATLFVFLLPLTLMRLGLMVGNWGQHAFVDADEPDSDYRSSVTLIDVPSNRYCYNDGYHVSHHLNPRRHWREHPVHFVQNKGTYGREQALVFHNIDYLMLTVRLLLRDYDHLARCLVPLGPTQIAMSTAERAAMLRRHTRRFTEDEIREKFARPAPADNKSKAA